MSDNHPDPETPTSEFTHRTSSTTPDFKTELAQQLADLMPEVVADGKIDTVKLKELLADDVADETERFGLFWPGKRRALRAAQEPTTATLRPDKANSKDWDTTQNVFIEGDNLEVLKILQKHYHNKIKLIYIDPPYNTGKDFVYPDNYKEGLETYLEWTRQVNEEGKKISTNSESEGRYHSNWLNMMYPRLKLARNLLTGDGLLMISIDDNEMSHLRKVCDEVFGEHNFQCHFIWLRKTAPKGVPPINMVVTSHEYVLCYSRSPLFRFLGLPRSLEGFANPDNDPRGPWRNTNIKSTVKAKADSFTIIDPSTGNEFTDAWAFSEAQLKTMIASGQVIFPKDRNGQVRAKEYFHEFKNANVPIITFQEKYDGQATSAALEKLLGGKLFQNPKSVELLKKLFSYTMDSGIMLDFFSGSGSAAHAIMQLNAEDGGNRRHISVQLPEPFDPADDAAKAGFKTISELCRQRISLAGEMIASAGNAKSSRFDAGFRSFALTDTNFAKWRVSSDTDRNALEQHLFSLRESASDDATPDDLLTEILLKQGYSLTEKISDSEIAGLDVRIVGDNMVLAYLTESIKPTLDQLRALVEQDPQRIIILEDAFQGDDELKTNLAQLCKSKGIELWTA